jgi:riboflavin kinase / FMN adenylyltransferase
MKISHELTEDLFEERPVILTIGNFDGVHVGHQAVLARVKEIAQERNLRTVVITFSNHPSKVLRPEHPVPLLCTLEHKLQLIEKAGIDRLILLSFTKELSEQSPETFLNKIQKTIPFSTLVLGSDATIGKNREGDRSFVTELGDKLGFGVEYLEDFTIDGQRVSSSQIRSSIRHGNFFLAEKLFGRPFSIYGCIIKGKNLGASIGYPTANIDVKELCLPPFGVYAVDLYYQGNKLAGIANLGIAPTVRHENTPILEVHLFNQQAALYGAFVEVLFKHYIRPEKRFESVDQLKEQIARDIQKAKDIPASTGC